MRLAILTFLTAISGQACSSAGPRASEYQAAFAAPSGRLRLGKLHVFANDVRYGVQAPLGEIHGDVLFLHGFGDRLDNHRPLFDAWNDAGYRVVSFDYPSHGETTGPDLDSFGGDLGPFRGLATIARAVDTATREDINRPLVIAGWSTGGLVAVRMVQGFIGDWPKPAPQAVILLAPGVAVRPIVGEGGTVTTATLTDNPSPPHLGPIVPNVPLEHPGFAADLLVNVAYAWAEGYPKNLPTLLITAGDEEDRYVLSPQIRQWAKQQRQGNKGVDIVGYHCRGAKHELDNDSAPVGNWVITRTVGFLSLASSGSTVAVAAPCGEF